MVDQRCATVMKCLERDGRIVQRALLPAPRKDADPCERQGPYGGLMGLALIALLLIVPLRPEGMPHRLRRPCDARVPEKCGTREAPVHPGLLAAPCGSWRDPGIFLEFGGGGRACALCAEGDEQPGGEDGARSWEGLEQGEIGMALRTLRDGGVDIGEGLQGDPERGDEGLHQERMGRDDACIGREGDGRCDVLDTLCHDLGVAHVRRTEEGFEGSTARELRRLAGRPATENVAADRRVFLLQPVQHVRDRVLEGPGQAVGDPDVVADHATAVCDELCEGAHRGALRLERLALVARGEPQGEWACGVGGVVCGPARGEGVALPRQRQGMDREEDEQVILAQGGDQGACGACETEGHGLTVEPRAPRGDPCVDGRGGVLELEAFPLCGASRLEAPVMCGIRPVDPNKGRKGFVCYRRHTVSPSVCESGDKGQAS